MELKYRVQEPDKPGNPLIMENCPCTRACPRHGNCVECVANHRDKVIGVPGCFFTEAGEATHDRGLENFFRDRGMK